MKEDMLEVLVYLFENYMVDGQEWETDHAEIEAELLGAGFDGVEISKAFLWLEELLIVCEQSGINSIPTPTTPVARCYIPAELERLGFEGRGLLDRLVSAGVLDLLSREMVIDRIMALDSVDISLDHVKWVVLLVLSNRPGCAEVGEWAEAIVNFGAVSILH